MRVLNVNRISDELLSARTVQELTFVESLGEEVVDVNMGVAANALIILSSDSLFSPIGMAKIHFLL